MKDNKHLPPDWEMYSLLEKARSHGSHYQDWEVYIYPLLMLSLKLKKKDKEKKTKKQK